MGRTASCAPSYRAVLTRTATNELSTETEEEAFVRNYLIGVARSAVADWFRAHRPAPVRAAPESEPPAEVEFADAISRIRGALLELPIELRVPFWLRHTRDVLKRWNESGPDGLADGRRCNGSASKLTDDQRAQLLAALKKRPPDGGLWSGPKVVRYVRATWSVEIAPQTGWKWRVDLGFTLPVPWPSHPKAADPATQRRREKTCDSG